MRHNGCKGPSFFSEFIDVAQPIVIGPDIGFYLFPIGEGPEVLQNRIVTDKIFHVWPFGIARFAGYQIDVRDVLGRQETF